MKLRGVVSFTGESYQENKFKEIDDDKDLCPKCTRLFKTFMDGEEADDEENYRVTDALRFADGSRAVSPRSFGGNAHCDSQSFEWQTTPNQEFHSGSDL